MKLYRPTGQLELILVLEAQLRAWPPRLSDQPIFYPVLNEAYAIEIASKWNTKSERNVGYVTAFEIDDGYAASFERQVVGAQSHEELWVAAEELTNFNTHLLGPIEVVRAYFGEGYVGHVPKAGPLQGLTADQQLAWLEHATSEQRAAVVGQARICVFLHMARWQQQGATAACLAQLEQAWLERYPQLPLFSG